MDFWDMAKLMWRRWYVTVPMLLLTAAGAVATASNVDPDYKTTDHIAVIPPILQRTSTETVTRVNPWTEESLADAASIRLMGKHVADEFEAAGYDAEWVVEVTGRLPVIRIEVVAPTARQAQTVMERLLQTVEQEVTDRQATYDIAPEEQITTVRYDEGETLETVTSKLKRALVVVVAVGLILTMAMVVSVDALIRRRQARRTDPTVVHEGRAPRYTYHEAPPPDGELVAPAAGANGNGHAGANSAVRFPVRVAYPDPANAVGEPAPAAPVSAPPAAADAAMDPVPEDATIVLPLSNVPWTRSSSAAKKAPAGDPDKTADVSKK